MLLAHHVEYGQRARWALGALLAATVAVVTRLPGPGVGPIPATGLISLQPDVYVLAVVVTVTAAWWTLAAASRPEERPHHHSSG